METAKAVYVCPPNAGAARKRKRVRNRLKNSVSCLNYRLNPEFDPAKHATEGLKGSAQEGNTDRPPSCSSSEIMSSATPASFIITSTFKIQMLNITLKFIKDPICKKLEYPQMTLVERQFVTSLLEQRNNCGTLGFGFKSMYAPLYEALKILERTYDLEIYTEPWTQRLILQKVLKNALENGTNDRSSNLNSSFVSQSSTESKKSDTRERLSTPELVRSLQESFIKGALEQAHNFLVQEDMATYEFKDLCDREADFVNRLPSICREDRLSSLFSPQCKSLANEVRIANKADNWNLEINLGRINKQTHTRTVKYIKAVAYKPPSVRSVVVRREPDAKTNSSDKQTNSISPRIIINVQQTPVQKTEDNQKEVQRNGALERERPMSEREKELERLYKRLVNKEKGKKAKKFIAFQSAGEQSVDTSDATAEVPPLTASDVPAAKLSIKQRKILEALATPFENDRAERMMRNMGWEGGALGARGDGLTEPIIPAIHLKPGAGLGHIRQTQNQNQNQNSQKSQFASTFAFRVEFLRLVLRFIRSEGDQQLFSYKEAFTQKEAKFMEHAVHILNARSPIQLGTDVEMFLINKIYKEYADKPTLRLVMRMHHDLTEFELTKTNKSSKSRKKKTKNKSATDLRIEVKNDTCNTNGDRNDSNTKNNANAERNLPIGNVDKVDNNKETGRDDSTDHIFTENVDDLAQELKSYGLSIKSAKTVGFRILFLEKLKQFLLSKKDILEVKLDNILNKKNKNYIESTVSEMNRRKWTPKSTDVENNIYREVQKISGDCYLNVDLGVYKFYLHKKFYQKRFTNSSLSTIPPPKSTDIKNTVIYKNNVAYPAEKYIEAETNGKDNTNKNATNRDKIETECLKSSGINGKIVDVDAIDGRNDKMEIENINEIKKVEAGNGNITNHDQIERAMPEMMNGRIVSDDDDDKTDVKNDKMDIEKVNVDNHETIKIESEIKNDKCPSEKTAKDKIRIEYVDDSDDDVLDILDTSDVNFESDIENPRHNEKNSFDLTKDSLSLDISNNDSVLDLNTSKSDSDCEFNIKSEVNNNHDIIKDKNSDFSYSKNALNVPNNSNNRCKRPSSLSSFRMVKKLKFVKHVAVINKNTNNVTIEEAKTVQKLISHSLDETLPLLECHGIQNGGLIFSCHSEKSFEWLINVLSVASDLKIVDADKCEQVHTMQLKINTFLRESAKTYFALLELYNTDLNTESWVVLNEKFCENSVILTVNIDENSFKYVSENGFSLFAGVDKVRFSILWD